MLLNFIVIVQEPWKASVSEVNQITPRDGTEPRALDVNDSKWNQWHLEGKANTWRYAKTARA